MTTMTTVSRSICSGSAAVSAHKRPQLPPATVASRARRVNMQEEGSGGSGSGRNVGSNSSEPSAAVISLSGNQNRLLVKLARPLFFSSMGTALCAAFMQWTGELGRLPESTVADAILTTFYSHLELMKDLLNPTMSGEVSLLFFAAFLMMQSIIHTIKKTMSRRGTRCDIFRFQRQGV